MLKNKGIYTLVAFFTFLSCQTSDNHLSQPFLSNLSATAVDPIYTTYTAALERSNFILDEGYVFEFSNAQKPIAFTTDTGGDLILGFRVDGLWIDQLGDHFSAPVITISYPDIVTYHYYPVAGVRVEADFAVYGSHAAFWDIRLINESSTEKSVEIAVLLKNDWRPVHDLEKMENGWLFSHEEYPDSWTISHQLPHADSIRNILSMSGSPDTLFALTEMSGESLLPPYAIFPQEKRIFEIGGRSQTAGGERILHPVRIQGFLNEHTGVLLTENSPIKGLPQPAIDRDGYRRTEFGWLPDAKAGKDFTIQIWDPESKLGGQIRESLENIPGGGRRIDLRLDKTIYPAPPDSVQITGLESGWLLSWGKSVDAANYHVYRRDYPVSFYNRIGSTSARQWLDRHAETGEVYGYVVVSVASDGGIGIQSKEVSTVVGLGFSDFLAGDQGSTVVSPFYRAVAMTKFFELVPGGQDSLRIIRAVSQVNEGEDLLWERHNAAAKASFAVLLSSNEQLFADVPLLNDVSDDIELLYWSAFNMVRQVFYPPEGKSSYNYYVFSREPTWGWGHGGQVFHESLTMLAYAFMDPESAMNSQRVYRERQYENGYINYRTGSYLDEIIEYEGSLTSSAPWYAWINWEVYQITGDKMFLKEMYTSSKRFYEFYVQNRDQDNDGLCEWGGHAVLESVRDAAVAVWDEVGWPSNFEGVDLNSMLVMEAKSLESMARELGYLEEAEKWRVDHVSRSLLINGLCWDPETQFYYHLDMIDNDFSFEKENDLKRREIIGFLPLWAGIADSIRAREMIEKHLLDPDQFWRPYGIPTLSAQDSYYNDKGYWNGPVWIEWNLFIMQALLNYGYVTEARELVDRVAEGMIIQLRENHNLWEFYSPDQPWAGYHKTYIWAAVINRMLMDVYGKK